MIRMTSEAAAREILGDLANRAVAGRAHYGDIGLQPQELSEDRRLSYGESALVRIAHAAWNGDQEARIVDIAWLDRATRQRVLQVLTELWGEY